jgi:hypothetical protein
MPASVDSGFRRGTDIVKALAMGAEALCIERRLAAGVAGYSRLVAGRSRPLLRGRGCRLARCRVSRRCFASARKGAVTRHELDQYTAASSSLRRNSSVMGPCADAALVSSIRMIGAAGASLAAGSRLSGQSGIRPPRSVSPPTPRPRQGQRYVFDTGPTRPC